MAYQRGIVHPSRTPCCSADIGNAAQRQAAVDLKGQGVYRQTIVSFVAHRDTRVWVLRLRWVFRGCARQGRQRFDHGYKKAAVELCDTA